MKRAFLPRRLPADVDEGEDSVRCARCVREGHAPGFIQQFQFDCRETRVSNY